MKRIMPFIISFIGVISDLFTTNIGLKIGLSEAHPLYNPIFAIVIFWSCLAILNFLISDRRALTFSTYAVAFYSFLGMINNILVISGVFPGLRF
jgi:hypothetical protein